MPVTQVFEFDPERLEGQFSDMQPAAEPVMRAESAVPGCCGRTRITVCCLESRTGYMLELPLKGRLPNESPLDPPGNYHYQVMTAQVQPPVLQVLSAHHGGVVAEITTTADGPSHCPPGVESKLRLEGLGGGTRVVPQIAWTWLAPAILDAGLLDDLDEALISLFHPFKMPELPAQTWSLDLPGCPISRVSARVAAFPDVRWVGRLTVSTKAAAESSSGYELTLDGDLACSYDGKRWQVQSVQQAKALCKWIDGLEMLARSAASILSLRPGARHHGLDNPRLVRLEPFRFEPWPQLTIHLDASLFEQTGNGLLGHALRMQVQGKPLIGASGEISLLGPWLEQEDKKPLINPLLAGVDAKRAEEIAQELGLWLVVDGEISLQVGVEARRPQQRTSAAGRSQGQIPMRVEARSMRDYDSFIIHQGGSDDAGCRAGFRVACEPSAETPMDDPREHKPKAAFQFTGLLVRGLERIRPGCCFRFSPAESPSDDQAAEAKGSLLAPARSWPADAKIEAPGEVPWCS